jgi:hypothetical protein
MEWIKEKLKKELLELDCDIEATPITDASNVVYTITLLKPMVPQDPLSFTVYVEEQDSYTTVLRKLCKVMEEFLNELDEYPEVYVQKLIKEKGMFPDVAELAASDCWIEYTLFQKFIYLHTVEVNLAAAGTYPETVEA